MTQAEIVLCSPVRSAVGTYGNAPGLNSGAAAVIVAEWSFAEKHGLQPWGRLVSYGVASVEPGMFGIGPVPAVRQ
jgi:acetyl-CoA C-acetyltransferase